VDHFFSCDSEAIGGWISENYTLPKLPPELGKCSSLLAYLQRVDCSSRSREDRLVKLGKLIKIGVKLKLGKVSVDLDAS